jgi:hypothetical protein
MYRLYHCRLRHSPQLNGEKIGNVGCCWIDERVWGTYERLGLIGLDRVNMLAVFCSMSSFGSMFSNPSGCAESFTHCRLGTEEQSTARGVGTGECSGDSQRRRTFVHFE